MGLVLRSKEDIFGSPSSCDIVDDSIVEKKSPTLKEEDDTSVEQINSRNNSSIEGTTDLLKGPTLGSNTY